MELVSGICPLCNQQIEVNTSEEVDFCKLCGKPFATKDAIKLYKENIERIEIGRKPPQEMMEKFYAIYAQDYKLAHRYLLDIVKKDYQKLDVSLLSISNIESLKYVYDTKTYSLGVEINYNKLYALNPYIAEMYFKVLHAETNTLIKEKLKFTVTGELTFFKLKLMSLEERLKYLLNSIAHWEGYKDVMDYDDEQDFFTDTIKKWKDIEDDITRYRYLKGKEFDDAYIVHTVDMARRISSTIFNGRYSFDKYIGEKLIKDFIIKRYVTTNIKNINDLIKCLEDFLSPTEKRKREEEAALKAWHDLRGNELIFWQQYIDLLKAGKAKAALSLLETKNRLFRTDEYTKFKTGLLGVKYTGAVHSLNAEKLAELSLKNLK